jgi:hypothetical protein
MDSQRERFRATMRSEQMARSAQIDDPALQATSQARSPRIKDDRKTGVTWGRKPRGEVQARDAVEQRAGKSTSRGAGQCGGIPSEATAR